MRTRTNRKLTALICLGAYILTVVAPGGLMVWCFGSDGHRALELPHQVVSIGNGAGGNGPSTLGQPTTGVVSPKSALSCSGIVSSSADCVDTPVVSTLLTRGSGLSKVDKDVFKALSAVVSSIPATAPLRSARWFRLADASLDFTSLSMLRVVILQI